MRRYTITLCITACAAAAQAQDLHTEITVDRTVQPVLREMTRLSGITPAIPIPEVTATQLNAAEYGEAGEVSSDISILPPAAWADTTAHTPYRGYASVGYLPLYNVEANLGYRLVATKTIGLGLWLQYNGESYNGNIPHFDDALLTNHVGTIGGNTGIHFTRNALFEGSGSATYKSIRTPYYLLDNGIEHRQSYKQEVRDITGKGYWSTRTGDVAYGLGGEMAYFDLGKQQPIALRSTHTPVRQALVKGKMHIGVCDGAVSWLGLTADYTVLRSRDMVYIVNGISTMYLTENLKMANIRPYLRFDNSNGLQAHVGVNVSLAKGYNGRKLVTPDVQLSWSPNDFVCVYGTASGGQHYNTMSTLIEENPYLDPSMAYGYTRIPIVARGGIKVGAYDGMELGLYGGYAMARDCLSPLITIKRSGLQVSTLVAENYDSWHIGAHVGYRYQSLFALGFDIKYGHANSETRSWYEWLDAPKVVSSVNLKVTPIKSLEIGIDYDLRYNRKARSEVFPYNEISTVLYKGIPNLGTVNDINLSAAYSVSEPLSVFMHIENLLDNRNLLISGMPMAGIHGIVGAALKF